MSVADVPSTTVWPTGTVTPVDKHLTRRLAFGRHGIARERHRQVHACVISVDAHISDKHVEE